MPTSSSKAKGAGTHVASATRNSRRLLDAKNAVATGSAPDAIQTLTKTLGGDGIHRNTRRLEIIDSRVGAYVKHGKWERALKDAKSMTRHHSASSKGYIWCGQIETHLMNDEASKAWYEHGLKKVRPSDRLYSAMQALLEKTNARIAEIRVVARTTDLTSSLPLEVIESILSYLDYRTHVVLLRVSKPWNAMLSKLNPLINTIDYTDAKRPIGLEMNKAVLRRFQDPKVLRLSNTARPVWKSIKSAWSSFNTLQVLELNMNGHPEGIHDLEGRDRLFHYAFGLRQLKRIRITGVPLTISFIHATLAECLDLESATFHNITKPVREKLSRRQLSYLEQWETAKSPTNKALRELDIAGTLWVMFCLPDGFLNGLASLQKLHCKHTSLMDSPNLDFSNAHNLEDISFEDSRVPYPTILVPSLKKLQLINTYDPEYVDLKVSKPAYPVHKLCSLTVHGGNCLVLLLGGRSTPPENLTELSCSFNHGGFYGNSIYAGSGFNEIQNTSWLTNVKHLNIAAQALDDSHGPGLAAKAGAIETITLADATITHLFIEEFMKQPDSRLRKVTLINCEKVRSDIIEYMGQRGVEVIIQKDNEIRGGRRAIDYSQQYPASWGL